MEKFLINGGGEGIEGPGASPAYSAVGRAGEDGLKTKVALQLALQSSRIHQSPSALSIYAEPL
jgi:hypothetical protein